MAEVGTKRNNDPWRGSRRALVVLRTTRGENNRFAITMKHLDLLLLLVSVAAVGLGCSFLAKGYRICAGYAGAEVCVDRPNLPLTNSLVVTNFP